MNRHDFMVFKEEVRNADEKHTIWNCGWLWLSLTNKQVTEICHILNDSPVVKKVEYLDFKNPIMLPSGLIISEGV